MLADPAVKDLKAQLAEIQAWKRQKEESEVEYQQRQAAAARQQQVQHVQEISRTVSEFRAAIDDHGQLKFPHFDVVQRQMGH